jgi:hypothetical protein
MVIKSSFFLVKEFMICNTGRGFLAGGCHLGCDTEVMSRRKIVGERMLRYLYSHGGDSFPSNDESHRRLIPSDSSNEFASALY